jgi:hypothetical protein
VIRQLLFVVIGGALLTACDSQPVPFAVPPQRSLDLGQDPGGLGPFVTMGDPAADDYIVRDISPGRDHHRWAFLHPEMRFRVKEPGYRKFVADFAIPQATFKDTGPVTITVAVDGTSLGAFRCDHAGDYLMEKPVPQGLLAPGKEVHVTFEATPRWISPTDRAELSFFLGSAGFTR